MKLILNHIGLTSIQGLDAWIEKQLGSLTPRLQIDAAHVRLVRLHDTSPPYRAEVHIVTPGPDVLPAAVAKVIKQLRNKIAQRASKRLQRTRSNKTDRTHASASKTLNRT